MMSCLVLFLPASSDSPALEWALVSDHEVKERGQLSPGAPMPLLDTSRLDRVVALVPSQAVFVRRASVPGKSQRDVSRAVPFLIEDHLAQPLENVVVEAGPAEEDGARFILAVDADLREVWRRAIAALGFKPVYALPDAMAFEGHGADLCAIEVGDRVLIQTRDGDLGFDPHEAVGDVDLALKRITASAVPTSMAREILPGLASRLAPKRVIVSEGFDPNLSAPDGVAIALKRVPTPDLALAAAARSERELLRLPPLFGSAFASSLDWAGLIGPWRLAAGLGLAAGLAFTALNMGQAIYLEDRANAYNEARIAAFESAFPQTRVVDVDAQLRIALASIGGAESGQGDFLALSAALAALLGEVDTVRVDSLRYDAEREGLSVSALYGGFGDFEALQEAARARNIVLEDGGARQTGDGVSGEFTVRLP